MTVHLPFSAMIHKHAPKRRRTATTVMAGQFDERPLRDVLTSLLNGVGPYKEVERDEEARRIRKKEKKERDRERKKAKAEAKARQKELIGDTLHAMPMNGSFPSASAPPQTQTATASTSSFWKARPTIHIATMQRSVSVTPPPSASPGIAPSTPGSTPGPSISSSTSRTSSKRPRTPDDDEYFHSQSRTLSAPLPVRRKRPAVKKGWKGWVEGSPPPSQKLINLDAVPVLQERRTRSGKNFDAIGVGKDGWV
ncbi:hypothetical protein BDQ12DRAFT_689712 [Crucibulum laeve]|uniref:Uncharacterized protein n=1 Tax=Crucibulum laeve TaxID=68775 RepID=A0A5C3LR82_9AGAR|nr:hypothetical protein BDQ12DRAFT_689712 [Crucibulum laeve]